MDSQYGFSISLSTGSQDHPRTQDDPSLGMLGKWFLVPDSSWHALSLQEVDQTKNTGARKSSLFGFDRVKMYLHGLVGDGIPLTTPSPLTKRGKILICPAEMIGQVCHTSVKCRQIRYYYTYN